ncbi:NUDIX hydrolase [Rossellomorea sp. YZS02]|uniref:NUDIX hydrolase n=1 Tax=Rossellomorea sp. YZS02 TaxID=3097358 RepID=UPI002A1636A6|nr:NUDIX domain-containing protein [Rossellomorea sp. YZS02]MDX8343165.1 NUDIX domain-containing protein [Rossellomorea sp. YZS02]
MNDYIKSMREKIGNDTLLTVGCGAFIQDKEGKLLLQRRFPDGLWGIPGGIMEIGEFFEETVKREVYEETNLEITNLKLFRIYSGSKGFATYPNGDRVYSVQIIFLATEYKGLLQKNIESSELSFISKQDLPLNINSHQEPFIMDWVKDVETPVIK